MADKNKEKKEKRILRHKRVRALIKGSKERPRLNVFKSNQHIWVQIIDDNKRHTLASASDLELKDSEKKKSKKEKAFLVGQLIAEKAKGLSIEKVVFDRGGWKYHGRIKSLSEGARKGGLEF